MASMPAAFQLLPIDVDWMGVMTSRIVLAIVVFLAFVIIGFTLGRVSTRIMRSLGIGDLVEGTAVERSARGLGSSTVAVMARLLSWFIYGVGALVGLHILRVLDANLFWEHVTIFVPQLFVAVLIVIVGTVLGEKVGLTLSDRLRGIKVPEITVIASLAKYSVILLSVLVALGQIGVATSALLVVFGAYVFGIVILGGIAGTELLRSATAGVYLLFHQPYGIGDEIQIGDRGGIVQEIDLFVTYIEAEEQEYVVPNAFIFRDGVERLD